MLEHTGATRVTDDKQDKQTKLCYQFSLCVKSNMTKSMPVCVCLGSKISGQKIGWFALQTHKVRITGRQSTCIKQQHTNNTALQAGMKLNL